MLGKLFSSNARVKILKLFLLHPESKFYIRQIARDLKLQVNSVRRELENLEEFGLLTSSLAISGKDAGERSSATTPLPSPKYPERGLGSVMGSGEQWFLKPPVVDSMGKEGKSREIKNIRLDKHEKKYYRVDSNFVLFEEIKQLIVKAQILYERSFINKLEKIGKAKLLILTGIFVNNLESPIDILIVGRFSNIKLAKLISELENELSKEINYTLMDSKEFKYRKDITDIFLYGILEGKKIIAIDKMGEN